MSASDPVDRSMAGSSRSSMSVRRSVARWSLVAVVQALSSSTADAQRIESSAPPTAADRPPVEAFFGRPKYSMFTLSPDGRLFAALVPALGRRNLALIDLEARSAKLLTSFRNEDVFSYRWVGDQTLEVRTADLGNAGGIFVKRTSLVDTSGREVRDLRSTGYRGPARIIGTMSRDGDELIVQSYERNAAGLDAYRYTPSNNRMELLTFENRGNVVQFVADRAGQVRVAVSESKDGTRQRLSYRRANGDKWITLRDEPVEAVSIAPLAFAFDNSTLYVAVPDPANGERDVIHAYDPDADRLGDRIYASGATDAGALVFDEVRKVLIGVRDASNDGVTWVDPEWKRLQDSVDAVMPNTRNFVAWARFDPSRIVVRTESDAQPPIYYLLDRKTHRMEEVGVAFPSLDEKSLSPRRAVRYAARDGLSIPAHLTMPVRPDGAKPPLIVDIHGGPFVEGSGFGYNAAAQFFASRGYAVLEPDFRGTQGYGRSFEQAGWKQWGLAMQDDVTDGVRWLIETGQVDRDRVCLFGASYGGYAVLWGLEKEPQMFRCGVAFVAVSDLELLFDVNWADTNRNDLDNASVNFARRTIGDPDKDRSKLREVSPLYHADRIQAPLFLAYGAADVRVPLIHGNRMRSALDKYGKPYEWVVYNDEGHGWSKDENTFDFYRRIEAFLARHLAVRPPFAATTGASKVAGWSP